MVCVLERARERRREVTRAAEQVKEDDRSVRNSVLGCDKNKDQEPE